MIVAGGHATSKWGYHQIWIVAGAILITTSGAVLCVFLQVLKAAVC